MWVARDKDGSLAVFNDPQPPTRQVCNGHEEWDGHNFMYIDPSLFPNLKWEDEPIEVSIIETFRLQSLQALK